MDNKWLHWAKRIQAISQSGIAFTKDEFDLERYEELRMISAEMLAEHVDLEVEQLHMLFANEEGYATPKVDVRGVVFQEGKILMVKEKIDDHWSLPGGFCDVGLSPTENIVKEIKEESGFDVKPTRLLAVMDKNKHPHPPEVYHYYKLFILCEIIGGQATKGIETQEIAFFEEHHLPPLSLNRNTQSQIKTMFEYDRNPNKKVIID